MPWTRSLGHMAASRRWAALLAFLILPCAGVGCAEGERSTMELPPALEAWLSEARARGEPVEWQQVTGRRKVVASNGMSLVNESRQLHRSLGLSHPMRALKALSQDRRRAESLIVEFEPCYEKLRRAAQLPVFAPELGPAPGGAPEIGALVHAWMLLEAHAGAFPEEASRDAAWFFATARRWHVRTWLEALYWDSHVEKGLGILRRVCSMGSAVLSPEQAAEFEEALFALERQHLAALQQRFFAMRFGLLFFVKEMFAGRDPWGGMGKDINAIGEISDELPEDMRRGLSMLTDQALRAVFESGRYRDRLDLLAQDALEGLEQFAQVIEAARDPAALREWYEDQEVEASAAVGSPFGHVTRCLTLLAELRLARLAVRLLGRSQTPSDEWLRELTFSAGVEDPLTGRPLEWRRTNSGFVLSCGALLIPTRTTNYELLEWIVEY